MADPEDKNSNGAELNKREIIEPIYKPGDTAEDRARADDLARRGVGERVTPKQMSPEEAKAFSDGLGSSPQYVMPGENAAPGFRAEYINPIYRPEDGPEDKARAERHARQGIGERVKVKHLSPEEAQNFIGGHDAEDFDGPFKTPSDEAQKQSSRIPNSSKDVMFKGKENAPQIKPAFTQAHDGVEIGPLNKGPDQEIKISRNLSDLSPK